MKQILLKKGSILVEDVPAPTIEADTVLVKVNASCISVGTETSGIKSSNMPLWKKALQQPEKVQKVFSHTKKHGLVETRNVVNKQLEAMHPLGNSISGEVIAVGKNISDLVVGDRVACAGSQSAFHAEIISSPRNLIARVPDEVTLLSASTVTLGAISLQGVRRGNPTIGETFVIIGLGLLGQITHQILKSNGVKTIGIDLDSSRVEKAKKLGLDYGFSNSSDIVEVIQKITDGIGADGVIVTAASSDDAIISTAFNLCRKKGRVVLVGDVGLNIDRADIYEKELDFFVSTSYGPGRYDKEYEEKGHDYPVSYVRWTENRNMEAYLSLIAKNNINVESLIDETYDIDEAQAAYEKLNNSAKPLALILQYPERADQTKSTIQYFKSNVEKNKKINVAIVGAGGFAASTLIPMMRSLDKDYEIKTVLTKKSHNSLKIAKEFEIPFATTDFSSILNDSEIDAVIIATRHNLHAEMVISSLEAGKNVFVEKPLCIDRNELNKIKQYYEDNNVNPPLLMCGFNRRFSPYINTIKSATENHVGPMVINYRVNAGYIPLDHWVHGDEGGGRNIGEACHFYDLFTYLTNNKVNKLNALSTRSSTKFYSNTDNFFANISFQDGSIASLTYTALGSQEQMKECMDIYVDGKIFSVNDYLSLSTFGSDIKSFSTRKMEKGHREELIAFSQALRNGGEWPIPLWQLIQATEISFDIQEQINS